jgi:predicted DNA-binding transcriptional regulator AlpA
VVKHGRPQPEGTGGAVGDSAQNHSTAPVEPPTLAEILADLARTLPLLRAAIERPAAAGLVEPLLAREDLATVLRCSLPTLDRLKAAGRLPRPDLVLSRSPRWRAETIRRWVEEGGRS